MLGKEGASKVDQIRDHPVVGIRPEAGKFKAVAGLFLLLFAALGILDSIPASAVGIVLGVGAVGDHEDLGVLKQTAACPEGISLIAVDLIEGLTDGHASALQLDMHQREAVDQDGDIIAVEVLGAVILADFVLVDDLKQIVVNVLLVDRVMFLEEPSSRFRT